MDFIASARAGARAGLAGLVVGGAAGWAGLLIGDGAPEVARVAGVVAWVLVLVLPVTAALVMRATERRLAPLVFALAAGVVGPVLFLMAAVQIPAVFGAAEAADVARLLGPRWRAPAAAAAAATVAAGYLAHRR